MNVFYLGVDNPVEVSAAGVPSAQIKVSMSGGDINRNGDGTYTVRPTGSPGTEAVVSVSAPGLNGSKNAEFAPNRGARIDGQAAALQSKAVPGDRYIFQDIKCKCPGDGADRNLGQLVFDIQ